jgi:UDP-N-acetyl-D-mannosaminuronate dehydrogenase
VNDSQPHFVFDLIKTALGNDLIGKHVAALGLAFKPDVDDLRQSPAIEVVRLLIQDGAIVNSYEPYKTDGELPGIRLMGTLEEAVGDADLLVLLVGHQDFIKLDPLQLSKLTPTRLAVDTVGGWDEQTWTEAGFHLIRLGVGKKELLSK